MKIAIIGYSGSGKSTLAKHLAQHYSIPKLHMDTLQFQPNWQESDREWMKEQMYNFLREHENWVIDGNYSFCYYEERMAQADQIIFFDFSPYNCLYRVCKRYLNYRHRTREDMAVGCPEKLDWNFIRWVLWDGRRPHTKERYQNICQTYSDKVVILHNQQEINYFLEKLSKR